MVTAFRSFRRSLPGIGFLAFLPFADFSESPKVESIDSKKVCLLKNCLPSGGPPSGSLIDSNFRISFMGSAPGTGSTVRPAIAYNSRNNRYLAVWKGGDDRTTHPDEREIYGQLIDAATGQSLRGNLRLTDMGRPYIPKPHFHGSDPAVAYNSIDNEFLVVFQGGDNSVRPAGRFEIFGQRVDGRTGGQLGNNDFLISNMNNATLTGYPDVSFNPDRNEYLVVWSGIDAAAPQAGLQIYGQILDSSGRAQGGSIQISSRGLFMFYPSTTYNSREQEYLVTWNARQGSQSDMQVFVQRIKGDTGARVFADPPAITDAGSLFGRPDVIYNEIDNEYLVVCHGSAPVGGETEVYGQRLDGLASEVGSNDFRISDMGPPLDSKYSALDSAVEHDSVNNEYLVVWYGDDDTGLLVDQEFEAYGQRLDARGGEMGTDIRLSFMGPDGDPSYGVSNTRNPARGPALAYSSRNREYLVVWDGIDDTPPLQQGEYEVFGQRVGFHQPDLNIVGSCPGPVTITVTGVSAGGPVYLAIAGGQGQASFRAGPCGTVVSGLNSLRLAPFAPNPAIAVGSPPTASFSQVIGPAFCQMYLQAFDLNSCKVSDVEQL